MSTKIEWTNLLPGYKGETWNPFPGCNKVSPACDHCWAERMANRLAANPKTAHIYKELITDGKWNGNVRKLTYKAFELGDGYKYPEIYDPIRWRKARLVAVNLMGDSFHEKMSDWQIDLMMGIAVLNPKHIFQFLTKRSERLKDYFSTPKDELIERWGKAVWNIGLCEDEAAAYCYVCNRLDHEWPAKNIWIGVSVENQEQASKRIPDLLEIPAAVRFISAEPMLGPISLDFSTTNFIHNTLTGEFLCEGMNETCISTKIDWVICGGESGPKARPMHPDWVKSLRDQCKSAGTPFFFKQWGEWIPEHKPKDGEPTCIVCGCTWSNACEGGCHWLENTGMNDICSCCGNARAGKLEDESLVFRVGKKKAGRLLDGAEYNEYPEIN